MASFGALQTRISNKLFGVVTDSNPGADLSTQVKEQINLSIDHFEEWHLWFNEAIVTIVLNIGDPVVPNLPSDFLAEIPNGGLVIDFSNTRFQIEKVTPIEYDNQNSQGSGMPFIYVNRQNQLELYFFPDTDYDLKLRYIKSYADLVNDVDTNDWLDNAERLIEYRTLADMYLDYRKDNQMSSIYEARVIQEMNRLKKENYKRTPSTNLITENIARRDGGFRTSVRIF